MALLKDTLIQGSARVTDTLYTNNININDILSTKKLVISSTTAEEHIQFSRTDNINYILFPNNASTGIGIGYSVAVNSCPLIINKTSVYPGITATLGTSGNRWNGVYSSTGDFSGDMTIKGSAYIGESSATGERRMQVQSAAGLIYMYSAGSATGNRGLYGKNANGTEYSIFSQNQSGFITSAVTWNFSKTTDASGTANNSPALIVGGTATSTHLEFDANEIMAKATGTTVATLFLNNEGGAVNINQGYGTTSASTAVDDSGLRIFSRRASNKSVVDAYSGYAAGATSYSWGYNHLAPNIAANANTCLLTGVDNSTNNQGVLEFHYAGSNNNSNYVGLGLYGNNGLLKIYKDKHVEFAGAITAGTWQGSAIGVAYGGTGAATFTSDYVIVGNGTNAMESRGLKVTGAVNADTTLTSSDGKALIIKSGSTTYIDSASSSSHIFRKGSTEVARFNTSGMLQLNTDVTQNTHKLLVNGDSAFTGKIAFIDTPAATLTEKVYIQQANNTIQLVAKAINFPTITGGTGITASDLGSSANPRYRPASWKYNAGITPVDGDIVTVKVPSGADDYGTWLSLDNGSTYYPIIHSNGSRLQNWFSSNMSITLRYDSLATCSVFGAVSSGSMVATNNRSTVTGCWRLITQYDTGNDGRWYVRYYTTKAYKAVTASHVIGGTSNGYTNVDDSTDAAFDIRYPVLFTGSNMAANATNNNVFTFHYAVNIKNSSGNNITFPAHVPLYIKGTISGYTFTPISGGNPFVSEITEADDGYVYYYIGKSYATTAMSFDTTARKILWYKNGIICDYTGLNNVSNNSSLNNISGSIGDIIYWSAANTPARLAKGTAGKFLKMGNNNVPIWGDGSEVTLNGTATTTPSFYAPADSGTVNYLLKSGGPNTAPVWDTHASIDSAGMLHILSVKAHDGFWVNDTYFKGDGTQHIKEALVCVDADNMNQGEVLYEYNASTSTSRFGLYTYANIYNDTSVNTYLTLGISTDGTVKRTYTDAQIYGAVWNDYAEYRKQLYEIEPGRVVRDLNSGHVVLTEERLIPGAQVVSDTFGFAIGETKECQTPLAVSGRVLVFTTQDRYKYNAGDAVCSGPHGTVDIMTREEIQKYPDAIVGIVSEIPTYDTWGQNEVPVQGRIWIKVR